MFLKLFVILFFMQIAKIIFFIMTKQRKYDKPKFIRGKARKFSN